MTSQPASTKRAPCAGLFGAWSNPDVQPANDHNRRAGDKPPVGPDKGAKA